MARVGLARDVEVVIAELAVNPEPLDEKIDHVPGDAGLGRVLGAVGEARAGGLVHVDERRVAIPRVGVQLRGRAVRVDFARAVLSEKSHRRRAARPARHPQDHGVRGRVVAGLEGPVKKMFRARRQINIAAVLLDAGVAEAGGLRLVERGRAVRQAEECGEAAHCFYACGNLTLQLLLPRLT